MNAAAQDDRLGDRLIGGMVALVFVWIFLNSMIGVLK